MELNNIFGIDKVAAEDGKWFPVPGDSGDVEFLIARINNPEWVRVTKELMKPYKGASRSRMLGQKVRDEITIKAMARTILLGWRGDLRVDEKDFPYSVENAERMLTDYPDARDFVSDRSTDLDEYRIIEDEDTAKNLRTVSGGSSSGANKKHGLQSLPKTGT